MLRSSAFPHHSGPIGTLILSYVLNAAREIAVRLKPGSLVVLESTTYPGTTDQEVRSILETSGLSTPDDFWLAFSPEREDPGNPSFSTAGIPKVVGGVNMESHNHRGRSILRW